MKTLEFSTKIKDGIIRIPDKHNNIDDNEVNVILQWEDNNKNYQSRNILSILEVIQRKKIFVKIENPSEWQRKIRNEW